jgi:hypothetical protein
MVCGDGTPVTDTSWSAANYRRHSGPLGCFFGLDPRRFLALQMDYDLYLARGCSTEVSPLDRRVSVSQAGARWVGAAGTPEPALHVISSDLVARLEAQDALTPARAHRELETVEYPGGFQAIVGVEP